LNLADSKRPSGWNDIDPRQCKFKVVTQLSCVHGVVNLSLMFARRTKGIECKGTTERRDLRKRSENWVVSEPCALATASGQCGNRGSEWKASRTEENVDEGREGKKAVQD
jgi:hypothetical protein